MKKRIAFNACTGEIIECYGTETQFKRTSKHLSMKGDGYNWRTYWVKGYSKRPCEIVFKAAKKLWD